MPNIKLSKEVTWTNITNIQTTTDVWKEVTHITLAHSWSKSTSTDVWYMESSPKEVTLHEQILL